MKILDVSAGNRAIWFNRKHPMATFLDIRPETEPDILCDSRDLARFDVDTFDLAAFDPPHVNAGARSNISRDYGHSTTDEIRDIVSQTSRELSRVVRKDGLMAFKWNDHDQKLSYVIGLIFKSWEPLFGHKVSHRNMRVSQTYWVLMRNNK